MFRCSECGNTSQKWQGKCGACGGWNTLEEVAEAPKGSKKSGREQSISTLSNTEPGESRIALRSSELNTVLWGGLTRGSLTLLSGEPGIGKSTLSLQIADWYATETHTSTYVSAEENIRQISARAKRLGIDNPYIRVFTTSTLEDILETVERDTSELVIVDSVSMIASSEIASSSGSVTQVRSVTEACMEFSKRTGKSVILIGHVTKDGSISGPKTLEHLVDTVLFLEGSRYEDYRILRTLKNRFGATDEIGLFRMTETGLVDMQNPGLEFIHPENETLPGSALTLTLEGNRPLLVEIEALTTYTKFGYPKRSARGIPSGKLDLILAVLSRWGGLKLESYDAYVNVSRGLTLTEPGIDLATAAAILSSKSGTPLGRTIFLGEVSLTGVVKNVAGLNRRIDEAVRLGFREIVCPKMGDSWKHAKSVAQMREISHIRELTNILDPQS